METWEYFTTIIEANMRIGSVYHSDDLPEGEHPMHSPLALIPQLNEFGKKGWEMISLRPVYVGERNHDILMHSENRLWTSYYLCAFKRRTQTI